MKRFASASLVVPMTAAATLGFALLAASCPSNDCTEMGCGDQLSFEIRPSSQPWPDGRYDLSVDTEMARLTCEFTLPQDLPPFGSVAELQCSGPARVSLSQDARCEERRTSNTVSEPCKPLEGQFVMQITFEGTPKHAALKLERAGDVVIDDDFTPKYTMEQPNGPGCDPVCRQAAVTLEF